MAKPPRASFAGRLLREPLLHFLLLGGLIFAVHALITPRGADLPIGEIFISRGQITSLAQGFERIWQRPPTDDELQELIRDRLREEVYCREAIRLGLDVDDTVIRRRLRQKMEFIAAEASAPAAPTEDQLLAHLNANPARFRLEQRYTFQHVYFSGAKRGEAAASDALQVLADLRNRRADPEVSALGDPFLLDEAFERVTSKQIGDLFGAEFAARLAQIPVGTWSGPIPSSYGVHLVLLAARTDGRQPTLAEVREAVRTDWESAHRADAAEEAYNQLLKRYKVTIENESTSLGGTQQAVKQ